MTEQTQKKKTKRIRGLGGIVQKQLAPLETNEYFIKRYSNLKVKLLLNAVDSKYAAIIDINNAKINIESISNTDKAALKKKVLQWDGMLATTTPIFLKVAMGELGIGAMAKKIVTRKIKAKGIKNLLILQKLFAVLRYVKKQ